MFVEIFAKTDVGRIRSGNEDNFLVLDLGAAKACTGSDPDAVPEELRRFELGPKGAVLAVSDGMGGALAGDVASRLAVETVRDALLDSFTDDAPTADAEATLVEFLRNATEFANDTIHRQSQSEARYSGMGATFTGAAVTTSGLDFVQVGDSRAYVIRGSEIRLATKDQSLVQQLVDVGQISEQEAETHMFRNVILQALGAQAEISPVTGGVHCKGAECRLHAGDTVLLCSDGLSGKLRAEEMLQIVLSARGDLGAACERLVAEANARGGEDNITVILARVSGDDLPSSDSHKITVELPHPDTDSTMGGEEDTQTP
jgi:serine/threonine protein phosphatase PrpC